MAEKKQNNELDLKKIDQVSGGSTRINANGDIEVLKNSNSELLGTFPQDQARNALDFDEAANGPRSDGFKPNFHPGPFGPHRPHGRHHF